MTGLANFHTHTTYCDGALTPAGMVDAAIEKGCTALGFTGHSYADFDPKHCMSLTDTPRYMAEVLALREKYAGKIELYLGIEQDYFSDPPPRGLDYIIGSVHYISVRGELVCVDNGAKRQRDAVDEHFGGDYYAFARAYFDTVADVPARTRADIIGHFDLVTKYNLGGELFDEKNPRYTDAAVDAMERILKTHRLFEVNTGAMYRLGKPEPYPSTFLLRELQKRGGEVILSSDSHDAESICHKFGEVTQLLKDCGFKHAKRLTAGGFVDYSL